MTLQMHHLEVLYRFHYNAPDNQSYGYVGGGYNTPFSVRISSVNRIDYSNDTPTDGSSNVARDRLGSSSNSILVIFLVELLLPCQR